MVKQFEVHISVFLFDISLNIDISIQQKTNLSGNFEGQTSKNYFKVKPARVSHILGRLLNQF